MPTPSLNICTILDPPQAAQTRVQLSGGSRGQASTDRAADKFDASSHSHSQHSRMPIHLTPPRSPRPVTDTRAFVSKEQQMVLLRQLCGPMLHHITLDTPRTSAHEATMRRITSKLVPHLMAPIDVMVFARHTHLRELLAYAIMACSAHPASHFELLHALYDDSVFFQIEGETLVHALMRNTLASETQKVTCLRLLASLGADLSQTDSAGTTPAILAARQIHDPYMMLLAIQSWDLAALLQCDYNGFSVADILLANPTPHVESFKLALSAEGMHLHPGCPQAWRPPLLPLMLAHYLPTLIAKPIGARGVDGAPLSFQ